jgi:hypothetical protein
MKNTRRIVLAIAAAALAAVLATAALGKDSTTSHMHSHAATTKAMTAADLRVTLDKLLGEHAALAMNATNAGVTGSKAFPAIAKQLDKNSVALSKAIASIYGKKAGNTFLNGNFMWRDHISFFVDYTVGVAKKDTMAQNKAVANLKTYTVKFGDFLAGATGLPKLAVRNDLLGHVLELKNQLDAFAAGNYAKSQTLYDGAFNHMFMTGDLLAGAIAKQKNLK